MLASIQSLALRALAARYDRILARQSLLDPSARRSRRDVAGPLNFLLIGSTRRTAPDAAPPTDAVMIGHVAPDLERAHLVAVPHHLRLDLPPFAGRDHQGDAHRVSTDRVSTDRVSTDRVSTDRVSTALAGGAGPDGGVGPDEAQQLSVALAALMGIRFDGAAIVDLGAIRPVIDLVGGVEVVVPTPVTSARTGTVFRPGQRRMAGEEALDYAGRHAAPDGDPDHHRRHQRLWRGIAARLTQLDVVGNPRRLDQVARGIGSALVVDTNGVSLEELARALRKVRGDEVSGVELPVRPPAEGAPTHTLPGAEAPGLFGSLRDGDLDSWARANPRWVDDSSGGAANPRESAD